MKANVENIHLQTRKRELERKGYLRNLQYVEPSRILLHGLKLEIRQRIQPKHVQGAQENL